MYGISKKAPAELPLTHILADQVVSLALIVKLELCRLELFPQFISSSTPSKPQQLAEIGWVINCGSEMKLPD